MNCISRTETIKRAKTNSNMIDVYIQNGFLTEVNGKIKEESLIKFLVLKELLRSKYITFKRAYNLLKGEKKFYDLIQSNRIKKEHIIDLNGVQILHSDKWVLKSIIIEICEEIKKTDEVSLTIYHASRELGCRKDSIILYADKDHLKYFDKEKTRISIDSLYEFKSFLKNLTENYTAVAKIPLNINQIHYLYDKGILKGKKFDYLINLSSFWIENKSLKNYMGKGFIDNNDYVELNGKTYNFKSIKNDYYSIHEVANFFGSSKISITRLINKNILPSVKNPNYFKNSKTRNTLKSYQYFIKKEDCVKLKNKLDDWNKNTYKLKELFRLFHLKHEGNFTKYKEQLDKIKHPFGLNEYGYAKESVENLIKSDPRLRKRIGDTYINSIERLTFYLNCLNFNPYQEETKQLFIEFSKKRILLLGNSKQVQITNEKATNKRINCLMGVANSIINCEIKKDIFLFSNQEILNLSSKTLTSYRPELKEFLEYVRNNRISKYDKIKIEKKLNSVEEKEIYTLDELVQFYIYCNEIQIHLDDAIKSKTYASSWLYLLIHLTNGWRTSDVVQIPEIKPEVVGIENKHWFQNSEISVPSSYKIINQLENFKMRVMKTGHKRKFNCEVGLIQTMVTAMCICEFHRRTTNHLSLINFQTKDGQPTKNHLNVFFDKNNIFKNKNMSFSSLKMNRTVMEHLFYSLSSNEKNSRTAFEMIKLLRDHHSDAAKHYIRSHNSNGETIDKTSFHMFERGEFGFIYDQLINSFSNDNKKNLTEEKTFAIKKFRNHFGLMNIETTAGFLQEREQEEEKLINQLLSLTEGDCFEYVRKLYLKEMPSKVDNIQCFSYPKCHRPQESSCQTCPFSIPNIHALNAIIADIKERIRRYNTSASLILKRKEGNRLTSVLELLSQAINKFGKEFVEEFIKNEFESTDNFYEQYHHIDMEVIEKLWENRQQES